MSHDADVRRLMVRAIAYHIIEHTGRNQEGALFVSALFAL